MWERRLGTRRRSPRPGGGRALLPGRSASERAPGCWARSMRMSSRPSAGSSHPASSARHGRRHWPPPAMPHPAGDPAARAGLALLRLREHRGGGHLLAVTAEGLTPLEAILAGPGPAKAAANGWDPPYPAVTGEDTQRLDAAGRRTDALTGMAYACLDTAERAELVSLLQAAHQRVTR